MNVTFIPNGTIEIDNARITHRNFAGIGSKYNREGDRNFSLIIDDPDIADRLLENTNRDGASWNVKIKPPREDGEDAFMYLPIKIKFNENGPVIRLCTGRKQTVLGPDEVHRLDKINISSVDMDIRPYDTFVSGQPYRTAYLKAMRVHQVVDRFAIDEEDEF